MRTRLKCTDDIASVSVSSLSNTRIRHEKEKETIYKKIDELRNDAVELLQSLIRIRSENFGVGRGDEKELADFVADYLRQWGAEVRQIEPFPRRVSNVGRLRGKIGKPVMLFNAHLDTVPAGDPRKWRYPPFAGEIHDGKIFGRGASDCKGGMAASLFAVRVLRECGIDLNGDLVLTQVAGEETGGLEGAAQLATYERTDGTRGLLRGIDFGIQSEDGILAPWTSKRGEISIGQRGISWIEITTYGKSGRWQSGHVNPIIKMCDVARAIQNIKFTGVKPHHVLPFGTDISVNMIKAGFKENVPPYDCTILCDLRLAPEHTVEMALEDINKVFDELKARDPELKVEVTKVLNEGRPWWVEPDSTIVKEVHKVIGEEFGFNVRIEGERSSGDKRFFVRDAGIPMCGSLAPASHTSHQPDEYAEIEALILAIKMQVALLLNTLL